MSPPPPSPAAATVLSLRDVSVGYDDRPTVAGIDLTVTLGDVVALVGPNGSGKSTLVKGILGLAPVLAGEIRLFGAPAPAPAQQHRIGYVPQRHTVGGAIPSTVEEVVGSGRLVHRRWFARATAADRAAVGAAIDAVGLGERRDAMVATLSGGQQRRVLIARALAGRPDVLIMDEPTAGVDAESQAALVRTLYRLVERGLTLLIVTHEIDPLRPVLTRVVALDAGHLVNDTLLPSPARLPVPSPVAVPELHGEYGGHHHPPTPLGEVGRPSPLPTPTFGPPGVVTEG